MKRHDKIFAMECTNTCHMNSRLNGHYCNFRLTLKILDLNKENMLKSKLLLSYVGREKKKIATWMCQKKLQDETCFANFTMIRCFNDWNAEGKYLLNIYTIIDFKCQENSKNSHLSVKFLFSAFMMLISANLFRYAYCFLSVNLFLDFRTFIYQFTV